MTSPNQSAARKQRSTAPRKKKKVDSTADTEEHVASYSVQAVSMDKITMPNGTELTYKRPVLAPIAHAMSITQPLFRVRRALDDTVASKKAPKANATASSFLNA